MNKPKFFTVPITCIDVQAAKRGGVPVLLGKFDLSMSVYTCDKCSKVHLNFEVNDMVHQLALEPEHAKILGQSLLDPGHANFGLGEEVPEDELQTLFERIDFTERKFDA